MSIDASISPGFVIDAYRDRRYIAGAFVVEIDGHKIEAVAVTSKDFATGHVEGYASNSEGAIRWLRARGCLTKHGTHIVHDALDFLREQLDSTSELNRVARALMSDQSPASQTDKK